MVVKHNGFRLDFPKKANPMNFWFELLKVYVLTWLLWIVRWHQYFLAFLVVPLKLNLTKSLFNILMVPYLNHHDHWLVVSTPLKNDGLRQLGWWNSQLNGKSFKIPWFQSPPTRSGSMTIFQPQAEAGLIRWLLRQPGWWNQWGPMRRS